MTIRLISPVNVGQKPSKFASCLEDYLLQESCNWDDRKTDIVNYILPYIIVINFKVFYNKEMAPAGGIRDALGTCSS